MLTGILMAALATILIIAQGVWRPTFSKSPSLNLQRKGSLSTGVVDGPMPSIDALI